MSCMSQIILLWRYLIFVSCFFSMFYHCLFLMRYTYHSITFIILKSTRYNNIYVENLLFKNITGKKHTAINPPQNIPLVFHIYLIRLATFGSNSGSLFLECFCLNCCGYLDVLNQIEHLFSWSFWLCVKARSCVVPDPVNKVYENTLGCFCKSALPCSGTWQHHSSYCFILLFITSCKATHKSNFWNVFRKWQNDGISVFEVGEGLWEALMAIYLLQ